jgi:hypothetical protein
MSAAILRSVASLIYTAIAMSPLAAEPIALRSYNAPIGESSISGVSSGAFMAVQFGTAWSSIIKGVGVVAGGPYWCAKADAYDAITLVLGPHLANHGIMHERIRVGPECEPLHHEGRRKSGSWRD